MTLIRLSLRLSAYVLATGCILHAQAQPIPPPTPSDLEQQRAQQRLEQQQQRIEQQQRERDRQIDQSAAALERAAQTHPYARLPEEEKPCFAIHEIRFAGVNDAAIPTPLLPGLRSALDFTRNPSSHAAVRDDPLGHCLGAAGINILLERAQNHLIARGYITSRVLAAPQNLKAGQLTLTVVPGQVSAIRRMPTAGAWRQASAAGLCTAIPTGPGQILNLRDIEQGLENLKRVPTADADIQIAPADTAALPPGTPPFGQSDLLVRYAQSRPVRLSASVDNSGTRNTGKYQGSLTLSVDNPLGLNDLFYTSASHDLGGGTPSADGARGTRGQVLSYSVPFGYWAVGGTWSANRYRQTVAGASQNYVYGGHSHTAEIFVSRVLYRDASRKTSATLKGWTRSSRNFIDDVEIEVQRRVESGWAAQLNHREYLGATSLDLGLSYKRGTGAFGALAAPEDAFGEGTSRFGLLTADAALNVPFTAGGQRLRYGGAWRWQHNRTALTPIDRFAIGGMYTVRGFDGEVMLLGERGWLLRNDLGLALGQSGQELYLGLDVGHVDGPSTAFEAGRTLAGAAVGLRGSGSGWSQGLRYDLFIGTPIHKPQRFRTAGVTLGFNLNWQY